MRGARKLVLALIYMVCCTVIAVYGLAHGSDPLSLAALPTSLATGLGVVIWGNVKSSEAFHKNGGGK